MGAPDPIIRFRALWWTLGACLAALVFVLGVLPGAALPTQGFNDKVNHFLAYLALTVWFGGLVQRKRWPWLALGLMLLGVMVEVVQTLTPFGRAGDWRDVLANAVGVALGFLIAAAGLSRWPLWLDGWLPRGKQA